MLAARRRPQQEAEAFARSVNSLEYTTRVQQDVYDYSWSVEVYSVTRHTEPASNDDHLPPTTVSR